MQQGLTERELLVALEKLKAKKRDICFDPVVDLDSKPCPTQLEIFKYKGDADDVKKIIVRAPNRTGKSQLGARIVSWWFQNNHPYIQRPKEWGDGPLTIMVVGENLSMMETEIWGNKIQPFLDPGCYHINRSGGAIQRIENVKNGNIILFRSHHGSENVREKLQGITAHIVWLDEMPSTASIMTELILRLLTKKGYFYATFTPLVKNDAIRKMCDQEGNGWITFTPMADNNPMHMNNIPKYEAFLRSISSSEEEYASRRYGVWWYGGSRVVKAYVPARHRHPLPSTYTPAWRHMAIVDPAASGKAGISILGEDPQTNKWWVVRAFYLDGDAPSKLVRSVETSLLGYNVIKRKSDCNPASFYLEALEQGIVYEPCREKNNRKGATIDILNEAFLQDKIMLADIPATDTLHEELMNCSWSEKNSEKIVNESSYHTLDTLRYFADDIPPPDVTARVFDGALHERKQLWQEGRRKEAEDFAKQKEGLPGKRSKYTIMKTRRFNWR